jgi:hypothetical protein
MTPRHLFTINACAVALLAPCALQAATAARECAGPRVGGDAAFRERFPELLQQLQTQLREAKGVDACAEVELGTTAEAILVTVSLPDGRTTTRQASRAEDVLPALRALLLVPEPGPAPAPAPAPPLPPAPRAPRRITAPHPSGLDALPYPTTKAREHGFELSVVSGARLGDGQYGYGGGVLSFIEIKHWLFGFQGRADGYRSLQGSDPETALTLGLLLGRRLDLGNTALDFTAGPALALRGATLSQRESVAVQQDSSRSSSLAPPPLHPERDVGPVPRLLLGARLGFSPRSIFRTFIGIDGELGPAGNSGAAPGFEVSGRMPAYTLGLSLGATVGTR